jgi:hypothetical protein
MMLGCQTQAGNLVDVAGRRNFDASDKPEMKLPVHVDLFQCYTILPRQWDPSVSVDLAERFKGDYTAIPRTQLSGNHSTVRMTNSLTHVESREK